MSKTDYEALEKSLGRLKQQYDFFKSNKETLTGNIAEAVQESVIQRFEVCFDTLWKHLKKYLKAEGVVGPLESPKPTFRSAHKNGLLDSEALNRYLECTDARNDTSHNYNSEKANEALGKVDSFIQDTIRLYGVISTQK